MNLSKNAEAIQKVLIEKGVDTRVVELATSTRTANDAAASIGCQVGQIVKSLLFRTKQTHQPVLVLASGINRVSESLIEKYVGEKMTKADADFTRQVTGFAIGGVPPIGHSNPISVIFIDEDLLQFETVWAAAGTPFAVFSMPSKALEEITNGKLVRIKE